VRIGVAASDAEGSLAFPVETVPRGPGDVDRIADLVVERVAIEVVVGLPRSLSGRDGPAAAAVREWTAGLAERLAPVPVRLVDERLTTVTAARRLRTAGVRGGRARAAVDRVAAVVLLQAALDVERATGAPCGEPVEPGPRRLS